MNPAEYVTSVKERLLSDPLVVSFHIRRERVTAIDGYLRVRVDFGDRGMLEFAEYVQHTSEEQIMVVTYSYHWADTNNQMLYRWDNTPHFPEVPGFPHHVHDGAADTVRSGQPMNIFTVLDFIAQRITESGRG